METDTRVLLDKILPQNWPSKHRRRRKLSPLRKKRGGMWNLRPFVTLSLRKRANAVVRLKNKIRMRKSVFGGRFFGGADLIDPDRPWQYQQDTQVYFCGTDKRVYWNAYIFTARKDFWAKVSEAAFDRARAMLSDEDREREFMSNFSPAKHDAWGYPTSFTLEKKEYTYPQFGGLSYGAYKDKLEMEIITSDPPEVYESFRIDREFEDGMGLYVVVDATHIDREVVERVIDRFFEVGETDWRADSPISLDKLPYETEMEFLMTIPPEKR